MSDSSEPESCSDGVVANRPAAAPLRVSIELPNGCT